MARATVWVNQSGGEFSQATSTRTRGTASSGGATQSASSDLLLLRQQNRRICCILGSIEIEGLYHFSLILVVERSRPGSPVQFFQPLEHLMPAHFPGTAMLAVWTVDSQEGQQVTDSSSRVHDQPRRGSSQSPYCVLRPTVYCISGNAGRIIPNDVVVSIKSDLISPQTVGRL